MPYSLDFLAVTLGMILDIRNPKRNAVQTILDPEYLTLIRIECLGSGGSVARPINTVISPGRSRDLVPLIRYSASEPGAMGVTCRKIYQVRILGSITREIVLEGSN